MKGFVSPTLGANLDVKMSSISKNIRPVHRKSLNVNFSLEYIVKYALKSD